MKRVFYVSMCLFLSLILTFVFVNGSTQYHTSYLYMNGGETVTGKTRSYEYDNHKITLYTKRLGCLEGEISCPNKLKIQLEKKGLISYSVKKVKTISMNTLNKTYSVVMGNYGSGKFRYVFNTGSSFDWYGLVSANPVKMYSYS